jgi:hypothetical protein
LHRRPGVQEVIDHFASAAIDMRTGQQAEREGKEDDDTDETGLL